MPLPRTGEGARRHRMIRRVVACAGRCVSLSTSPRASTTRAGHEVALTPHGALFRSAELGLSLSTRC